MLVDKDFARVFLNEMLVQPNEIIGRKCKTSAESVFFLSQLMSRAQGQFHFIH